MFKQVGVVGVVLVAVWLACGVCADEGTHIYKKGEAVRVYGNKIGPLHNSFETYEFFRIPGCPPLNWEQKEPNLGQALVGDELYEMNMKIRFGVDVEDGVICQFKPIQGDLKRWSLMITDHYAYQLFVDGLPLWASLGKMILTDATPKTPTSTPSKNPLIYLHRNFYFGINNGQIVNVTLQTSNPTSLTMEKEYTFTYTAHFLPSSISFEDRFAKYVDEELFEPRIRWFSIINSLILILFLVIVITMILSRMLRADYQRMEHELRMHEEGNDDLVDSTGWKQLYADVHRVPPFPTLLSALVGTGVQLTLLLLLGVTSGAIRSYRGSSTHGAVTFLTVSYALTGTVAGFVASWQFLWYATLNPSLSRRWMQSMALTMCAFPLLLACCGGATNLIAHVYNSAQTVHFGGVAFVMALLVFGYAPLVVFGTLIGRYTFRRFALTPRSHRELPHVNQIPRLIPPPQYAILSTPLFVCICGSLPFGSIKFELHLVLSSIWLYKHYYLYTFLLLTFFMFLLITSCVAIAATYVLLNMENHRWPWISFGFGASCGLYVYAYSVYFYHFQTKMDGFFMLVFYFTYSATLSTAISLVGGAVAHLTASVFVRKIYTFVKLD